MQSSSQDSALLGSNVPYIAYNDNDPLEDNESSFPLYSNSSDRDRLLNQGFTSTYDPEPEDDYEEDEAPPSLMIELNHLNQPRPNQVPRRKGLSRVYKSIPTSELRERALYRWHNIDNLDVFFERVYSYYTGKGIYCILLSRVLNLLSFAFIIGFTLFIVDCVDYSKIQPDGHLSDIVIPQCITRLSGVSALFTIIFFVFWIWQFLRLIFDIRGLFDMYHFYTYLLEIPDVDMQTIEWREVVNRIIDLNEHNPSVLANQQSRMNVHSIANRIMRKENYMIALFNKEILDLTIPFPFLRHRKILTKTLEWNLSFCIVSYVFDEQGQVRKRFLRDVQRGHLVQGLKRRFYFMGIINIIFAPFIIIYLILFFFFRYFEEYYKNPSSLGSRQYTPFARWKFREFNELPHLFQKRLTNSYDNAMKYINQFPKEKTALISRFVAFIAGSFAAVLAVITIVDQEVLLGFQISPDKTVFFYIGVFGTILAISRGMIPSENHVFEPQNMLQEVVEDTHYLPLEWQGKLHTDEVRKQFCELFDYKVSIFLQETLSVIFTPFILWISLPSCSEKIVDFFREFTVHVDGVGYVCSFAVFNFKRNGNIKYGAPAETENEYFASKEGKMEKSFLNFKANNPEWQPNDPSASIFLSRFNEFSNNARHVSISESPEFAMGSSNILRNRHGYDNLRRGSTFKSPNVRRPVAIPKVYVADEDSGQISGSEGTAESALLSSGSSLHGHHHGRSGAGIIALLNQIYENNGLLG
ncbi:APG9-domain-containing protein [Basidiobolus meristosporus CBS 931.73]|uniref:Autophagy-related protein 9 n=1 Tax=Basidiobolus meristosporus CBS 931.73 TaxID=1314790 RepID=A0A1Y1Y6E9_9FUNG|nr:APG9-domain-containing protein [Basidiobolus meristosporus CBS 931.73]|eukprot:ORX93600.1 APG9-domain-containing protein [Basidiobolus meristosporus CBS 931.73]